MEPRSWRRPLATGYGTFQKATLISQKQWTPLTRHMNCIWEARPIGCMWFLIILLGNLRWPRWGFRLLMKSVSRVSTSYFDAWSQLAGQEDPLKDCSFCQVQMKMKWELYRLWWGDQNLVVIDEPLEIHFLWNKACVEKQRLHKVIWDSHTPRSSTRSLDLFGPSEPYKTVQKPHLSSVKETSFLSFPFHGIDHVPAYTYSLFHVLLFPLSMWIFS